MFRQPEPTALLQHSLQGLLAQLPALRDGQEEAIHDARVAIRRLLEAASVARRNYDDDSFTDIERRLTRFFKALGRARDADSAQRLVQHVESRFPLAPATLGQLRASVEHAQLRSRRKVVKALESLEIERIPGQLQAARKAQARFRRDNSWRGRMRGHIAQRASNLREAIDHASGVYFPKRAHSVRVALKQFRYALELGMITGGDGAAHSRRPLRKVQTWLGDAHDREVLLERLHDLSAEDVTVNSQESAAVEQFLTSELAELHQRYLAARPAIVDACRSVTGTSRAGMQTLSVVTAAIAIPALLELERRRRLRTAQHRPLPLRDPAATPRNASPPTVDARQDTPIGTY